MNTSLPEWSWWKGVLRSEVCRLMERGSVTLDEYQALRCNGIETELIAPHLTNEAFVEYAERRLANVTYDPQQFIGFTVPELIKRLRATLERLANHDRMHSATKWATSE